MQQQLAGLLPMILVFVVFYFLLIRPQQKQRKERMEMLASLKRGDKVVSIGGIHGTITEVKEKTIKLKVADNLELKMNREAVGYVLKEAKVKEGKGKDKPEAGADKGAGESVANRSEEAKKE
ncbi:MAG: preprotein translocase subunit YajC [Bacillota bacterium]|nr:preprotein translocase subunit YajC [Bacillota bacterium]MDK2925716.1 preprotein translocase subunit YajC [Bacillota bacterium]MDK2960007.1 preprotein translocase subunit YajC [Bacillota bacterium]